MQKCFSLLILAMCLYQWCDAAPMFRPSQEKASVRYGMVSPPNPELKTGVMGIVPNSQTYNSRSAASLAAFVARQFSAGKWSRLEIYVFADRKTAMTFANYQMPRRSRPLRAKDFQKLRHLWPKTLAFYSKEKSRVLVLYPSKNPTSWWRKLP